MMKQITLTAVLMVETVVELVSTAIAAPNVSVTLLVMEYLMLWLAMASVMMRPIMSLATLMDLTVVAWIQIKNFVMVIQSYISQVL